MGNKDTSQNPIRQITNKGFKVVLFGSPKTKTKIKLQKVDFLLL